MNPNRRALAESVGAAVCGYIVAAVLEAALIRCVRPTEWELAWVSDAALAVALGIAVYLWRHLLTTRRELAGARASRARVADATVDRRRDPETVAARRSADGQRVRMGGRAQVGRKDRWRLLRLRRDRSERLDRAGGRRLRQGDPRRDGSWIVAFGVSRARAPELPIQRES